MNQTQRIAFFVVLAFAAGILFIHFPFRGYVYEQEVVVKFASAPCPPYPTSQEALNASKEELAKIFEQARLCTNQIETRLLPPWEWVSIAPIFPWFGSLANTVASLFLLCFIGSLACWIFRTTETRT